MPKINDPILAEFATFAQQLADESGQIIRRYYRSGYEIETKADETPVTIADRQAEEVMRSAIQNAYPAHGILGEEHGLHQPDAEYQWVLDPIDGTKSFVTGTYLFGTLIALVKKGIPILGVINNPIVGDFLLGTDGQTWLNDQPVRVSDVALVDNAFLVTTSHTDCIAYRDGQAFDTLIQKTKRYRTWGDCHGYHLVATGGVEIMADPILSYWDLMALIPIIQGSGGTITDWYGNDILSTKGEAGAVATNGHLHEAVIATLNPNS